MESYNIILTVVFILLSAVFALYGVKACAQTVQEKGNQPRKGLLRKALSLMALALMFFLCALYLIFRISWFMMIVLVIGFLAVGTVVGSGLVANMREH